MESLTFTTQLAQQAGALLVDCFRHTGSATAQKPDRSVVTEADVAADRLIAAAIAEQYPQDTILSEELRPNLAGNAAAVWVVDPLDGTTNFSLGLQHWGVSIARVVNGWPDTAAVFFPLLNELYTAQRGQGAWLNGERIRVSPPSKERPAAFFSCCTRAQKRYHLSVPYKTRIFGSTAYTLCVTARGAAVLGFEVKPKIWDIAAGWLVLREAGGVMDVLDGEQPFPLRLRGDFIGHSFLTLAAATPELLEKARGWIARRSEA